MSDRFPHVCTACKAPAYVGFNSVECSNSRCPEPAETSRYGSPDAYLTYHDFDKARNQLATQLKLSRQKRPHHRR